MSKIVRGTSTYARLIDWKTEQHLSREHARIFVAGYC